MDVGRPFDFVNKLTCIMAGRLILNVLSASGSERGAYNNSITDGHRAQRPGGVDSGR